MGVLALVAGNFPWKPHRLQGFSPLEEGTGARMIDWTLKKLIETAYMDMKERL